MKIINKKLLFFVVLLFFNLFFLVKPVNAAESITIQWNYPSNPSTTPYPQAGSKDQWNKVYDGQFVGTDINGGNWTIPISVPAGVSGPIEIILSYPLDKVDGVDYDWQYLYASMYILESTSATGITLAGTMTYSSCGNAIDQIDAKVYYVPITSPCGSADNQATNSAPTSNLCPPGSVAYPDPVSGSGPWSWICYNPLNNPDTQVSGSSDYTSFPSSGPQVTVTFNSQGGTTEAVPTTESTTQGSTLHYLPANPKKTGYFFTGWYFSPDTGGGIFNSTTVVTSDITVYAHWNNNPTVSWSPNSTGEKTCASLGTGWHCRSAYDPAGNILKCNTPAPSGFVMCTPYIGEAEWYADTNPPTNSNGDTVCAPHGYWSGGACISAEDSSGNSIDCSTNSLGGYAWCAGAPITLLSWSPNSSGNFSCAIRNQTCYAAYDYSGDNISCSASISSGFAFCDGPSESSNPPVVWSPVTNGYAECTAMRGSPSPCAYARDSSGNPIDCGTFTTKGNANCSYTSSGPNNYPPHFWNAESSGNESCSKFGSGYAGDGSTCLYAFDSSGNSIDCSEMTLSGLAMCSPLSGGGPMEWITPASGDSCTNCAPLDPATSNSSGNIACRDGVCLGAYDDSGNIITCSTEVSNGHVLCDSETTYQNIFWRSPYVKWNSAAKTGNLVCNNLYDFSCARVTDLVTGRQIDCGATTVNGDAVCVAPYGVYYMDMFWFPFSSGDSVCAEYNGECLSATNSTGDSIPCSDEVNVGTASCKKAYDVITLDPGFWNKTYTGNASCASLTGWNDPNPGVCLYAYDSYSGRNIGCGTSSQHGVAQCLSEGSGISNQPWIENSNGDTACGSKNQVCLIVYNSQGSSIGCTDFISDGIAICAGNLSDDGVSVLWPFYPPASSSDNPVCNGNDPSCAYVYNPGQTYIDCSVPSSDGTNQCGYTSITVGLGDGGCSSPDTDGTCGPADGEASLVAPSAGNLCLTGTASSISGTGPWTWTCSGTSGTDSTTPCTKIMTTIPCEPTYSNSTVSCLVKDPHNESCTFDMDCGPDPDLEGGGVCRNNFCYREDQSRCSNNQGCSSATNYYCSEEVGTGCLNAWCDKSVDKCYEPICPGQTQDPVYDSSSGDCYCSSATVGTNADCSAPVIINGTCGSADGEVATVIPTDPATLCSTGTASSVSGTGPPWTWTCSGNEGGITASCSTQGFFRGTCGSADGVPTLVAPTANLCSTGTAINFSGTGPWTWTCAGVEDGNASCSAPSSGTLPIVTQVGDGSQGADALKLDVDTPLTIGVSGTFQPFYCQDTLDIYWNYVDLSSPELKFDFQIASSDFDRNSDNCPDSGCVVSDLGNTKISQSEQFSFQQGQQNSLSYNTKYYWRVRVYDSNNNSSVWYYGHTFRTPAHAYPNPGFTPSPASAPLISGIDSVTFTDSSMCFDSTETSYLCSSKNNPSGQPNQYSWTFGDNGDHVDDSTVGSPSHNYTVIGTYISSLQVCDDVDCCSTSSSITVRNPLGVPIWKEVSPF